MKMPTVLTIFIVALIGFAVGCGPKTARVSGKITFDGQPAKDISVLFQAISSGNTTPEPAVGMTDTNGEFSLALTNSKKKGVIPGEYAVYIAWVNPEQVNAVEGVTKASSCPYKIPPRASSGEMTFTVSPERTTEANFEFDTSKESYKPSGV